MKNPFASIVKKSERDRDLRNGMNTPPATLNNGNEEIIIRSPGDYDSSRQATELDISCKNVETVEESNLKALEVLTEKTGMPITQENGQRRYGPPLDCDITVPPRGSEVFVGKLPRDCYEPEIVPVFEKAGKIYEIRLMMDFSGTNRGYCFVHYYTPEEADQAVRELNNFEIRKGRRIGVVKSVDNCRLFFGDVPKDKNEVEIKKQVDKLTDGVVKVIIYPSPAANEKNRGFAFVEYHSHKAAAMARRKLVSGKVQMWGVDIAVDWAEPFEADVKSNIISPSNNGTRTQQPKKESQVFQLRTRDAPPRGQHDGTYDNIPGLLGQSKSNFLWAQPQSSVGQGMFASNGLVPENYYQAYTNVNLQYYSRRNVMTRNLSSATMNQAAGQPYYGIPGVPPNLYYGQWSPQLDHSTMVFQPPPKLCNVNGCMLYNTM